MVTNKIKISHDEKSISNKDHLFIRQRISYIFGQTLAIEVIDIFVLHEILERTANNK